MIFKSLCRFLLQKPNRTSIIHAFNYCSASGTNPSKPVVSLQNIKQAFKQRHLRITNGNTCIVSDCPLCDNAKKGSKLYIHKNSGYFICDNCRYTGSWSILETMLPVTKEKKKSPDTKPLKEAFKVEDDFHDEWTKAKEASVNISDLSDVEYKNLLSNLAFTDLLQNSLSSLNCCYNKTLNVLYFPLVDVSNTIVGYKQLTLSGQEKTVPDMNATGCIFYKAEKCAANKHAILVGSVSDFLTLASENLKETIICLPYGLKQVPEKLLPVLEQYTKLVLWLASTEQCWQLTKDLAKKLGEQRCYAIRPTELHPLPKIALELGYKIPNILKEMYPIWVDNVTTFEYFKNDVLMELQNVGTTNGVQWTRFPTLNKILKGHRPGELTVMTGPTGCGKTTFISEYSLDLAMQGVNTLWGSFEIRNTRLAKTMLQQFVGFSLEQHLDKFDVSAQAFNLLPIFFMTFHGQQDIKVVMATIEHATYVHNIQHVIIDNMQFMMGTSEQHVDRYWKQDVVVSKFRTFASKANCHVTLVIHPRKERAEEDLTSQSIFGTAKVSQEADNILIIQDKRLCSPRGKKYLQIAKNRYSGDLGIMPLDFDVNSLSHAQKKKDKAGDPDKPKKRSLKAQEDHTIESLTGMNFDIWASEH